VVTVTFRGLSLIVVTRCYSYGKIESEDPVNQLSDPNPRLKSLIHVTILKWILGWDGMDWIDMAEVGNQWRALVNTVMDL
jgi:hypothetical protein